MNDLESAKVALENAIAFCEHDRKVREAQMNELTKLNKALSRQVYEYNVAVMSGDTMRMITATDKIIDAQDAIKEYKARQ